VLSLLTQHTEREREREREIFPKLLVWGKETAAAGDPRRQSRGARDKTQKSSRRRRTLFEKREVAEEEEDAREERWVDRPRNPRS